MPVSHSFSNIDLRVMREGLCLSASTAAEYIGGCSRSTWLQYELDALPLPLEVVEKICGLNETRIQLKKVYIERIQAVKPNVLPFFSSLVAFKMYYPDATDVTFSIFSAISREVYLDQLSEGLVDVSTDDFPFDKGLLLPECINCEAFTVYNLQRSNVTRH